MHRRRLQRALPWMPKGCNLVTVMRRLLLSPSFWTTFVSTALLTGSVFLWELGFFAAFLPALPRTEPTAGEILFTALLIILISLNTGLAVFRMKQGTCPIGTRRATAFASGIGIFTLLCPVCLLLPVSVVGIGLSLSLLAPFLPLLRVIAVLLLLVSGWMLWPGKKR